MSASFCALAKTGRYLSAGFDPPPRSRLEPTENGGDLLRFDGVGSEADDTMVRLWYWMTRRWVARKWMGRTSGKCKRVARGARVKEERRRSRKNTVCKDRRRGEKDASVYQVAPVLFFRVVFISLSQLFVILLTLLRGHLATCWFSCCLCFYRNCCRLL